MGFMDFLSNLGSGSQLRKLQKIADQVNLIEEDFQEMSDAELKEQTDTFKERLEDGEDLDSLMPEAFATVREASVRVLNKRHFDVQIMGGAALHWGNIAEMKTGEGKTLVGTLPSYLNALSGKGVHIVTTNDYLAKYQSEQMDGSTIPRSRGRGHPGIDVSGRTQGGLQVRHHLRHQQRVRVRLLEGQHGAQQ